MICLFFITFSLHVFVVFSKFNFFMGNSPPFLEFLDFTKLYCVIRFLSQVWGYLSIHAHANAFQTPKRFFGWNFPHFLKFIDFTTATTTKEFCCLAPAFPFLDKLSSQTGSKWCFNTTCLEVQESAKIHLLGH